MKRQILPIVAGIISMVVLFGSLQAQTVITRTFTFTGRDASSNYVRLNRIVVTNHTRGWEETLIWPDTVLTLEKETGVDESIANTCFNLSQNNPNPFTGTTDVNLTVADAGTLTLEIMDVNGRAVVGANDYSPLPGIHQFRITLSAAGTYVMTARQNGESSSIKMVNNGGGNGDGIEYEGVVRANNHSPLQPKSHTRGTVVRPFNIGDQMEYVGYATINGIEEESQHITQSLSTSQTFVLHFPTSQFHLPVVTTSSVTDITGTSASCGGNVTFDGYDSVTARGICWSTSSAPTIADSHTTDGSGTGIFTSTLTGLIIGNTYYVRAYATNSVGTTYGDEVCFASITRPTVITMDGSDIAAVTATCGGEVTSDGGDNVTTRGVCWSISHNPTVADSHTTNGSGTGSFISDLTGLYAGTTFYVRAYAANSVGTAYGNEVSFTTENYIPEGDAQPCPGVPTVTDVDGNVYNTVKIGNQCWMRENLRTTRYEYGEEIPISTAISDHDPYRVAPNNDEANVTDYGYLYNWSAVMHGSYSTSSANPSGVQGVCPAGWHVPSDAEWSQLSNYVSSQIQSTYVCHGDPSNIGSALADTMAWLSSQNHESCNVCYSANNATGFSARPAGEKACVNNELSFFGYYTFFWSSTSLGSGYENYAYYRCIFYQYPDFGRDRQGKCRSYSVRCILGEGAVPPTVTTDSISNCTFSTATCGGEVTATGGSAVTDRGVCWSTTPNPTRSNSYATSGGGTGNFTANLSLLIPNTTYYVRAFAISMGGIAYGNEVVFTTPADPFHDGEPCTSAATVIDRDSNIYNTVQVGNQCWMKENLRTTQYADGTPILQGSVDSDADAYWFYPNNDPSNKPTYGLLYNWIALMHGASGSNANPSGVQGICPDGWHVPSDAECTQLTNYVSSRGQYVCYNNVNFIAKVLAATTGWNSSYVNCAIGNNLASNNTTGFGALPAGRYGSGFGSYGYYWSTTYSGNDEAYYRHFHYASPRIERYTYYTSSGHSVRCIRD